jgi:hypothetical protein
MVYFGIKRQLQLYSVIQQITARQETMLHGTGLFGLQLVPDLIRATCWRTHLTEKIGLLVPEQVVLQPPIYSQIARTV